MFQKQKKNNQDNFLKLAQIKQQLYKEIIMQYNERNTKENLNISLMGGSLSERIHSKTLNYPRQQYILTSHKKRAVKNQNYHDMILPSLGSPKNKRDIDQIKQGKLAIKFQPQKIRQILFD